MDQQLKDSFNLVLVSAGHLLTYLSSNSAQKAIPNPPLTLQSTIDQGVNGYQTVLDRIELEIQLSRKYLNNAIAERVKREQDRLRLEQERIRQENERKKQEETRQQEEQIQKQTQQQQQNDTNSNKLNDSISEASLNLANLDDGSFGLDLDINMNDLPDLSSMGNNPDNLVDSSQLATGDGQGEAAAGQGDVERYDDQHNQNLEAFDDDLNALLGTVSGQQDGENNDLFNDDMGGLFGDDFDFIPTEYNN